MAFLGQQFCVPRRLERPLPHQAPTELCDPRRSALPLADGLAADLARWPSRWPFRRQAGSDGCDDPNRLFTALESGCPQRTPARLAWWRSKRPAAGRDFISCRSRYWKSWSVITCT